MIGPPEGKSLGVADVPCRLFTPGAVIPGAIPVHALFPVLNMGVTNLETSRVQYSYVFT